MGRGARQGYQDGFQVSSSAYEFWGHGQEMESRRKIRFLRYVTNSELISGKSMWKYLSGLAEDKI